MHSISENKIARNHLVAVRNILLASVYPVFVLMSWTELKQSYNILQDVNLQALIIYL